MSKNKNNKINKNTANDQKIRSWLYQLIIGKNKNISIMEKVIKFIIFSALLLVIKPSRWKDPKGCYELIDRTYKKIASADFVYIPSSIAFYLIMAFMPLLSLISFAYTIPAISDFVGDSIGSILGSFIPGIEEILKQLGEISQKNIQNNVLTIVSTTIYLIITIWIASGGFAKLVYTQSYIFNHKFVGGFWMNKFRGMFIVALFTFYLLFALFINVFIEKGIYGLNISLYHKDIILKIILVVGFFFLLLSSLVLFYKFSPRFKIKLRHVIPGAMVTTVPTAFFLSLFGLITSAWTYSLYYGTIGMILYVGMSCLLISYFVFVGIVTNNSYHKVFANYKLGTKRMLSKK